MSRNQQLGALGAAGLGILALLTWMRRSRGRRTEGQEVPYAKGCLPFVGHLLRVIPLAKDNNKIAGGRFAHIVAEEEGLNIFRSSFMGTKLIFCSDPDLAQEVVTHDPKGYTKDFSGLGKGFDLVTEVFGGTGQFFIATDDPRWGITHRILQGAFSQKGMMEFVPVMNEQANKLVEALKRDVGFGGVTHIDKWVTKMAFETIAVCGLGTSFGSFDDDAEHPFIEALNDSLANLKVFGVLPKWLWWLKRKEYNKLMQQGKLLRDTCVDTIRKRREGITTIKAGGHPDLLDRMLNEKDPKTGEKMTEEMIIDNVLTFLFAGQDSTAAAMSTCLCYLNANPEVEAKLVKEIQEVVGNRDICWEDLAKMTYLDWCLRETMRLVPPASGTLRMANGDQILGGKWHIRDKEQIVVGIMAMQYSTKIWGPDAAKFRPERWENGTPHKYAYLPFAHGPRACIGRWFTIIEQKITIVKLLQAFMLRRPNEVGTPEKGYHTIKREDLIPPLEINMDVEFRASSAFVGMYSAFELIERKENEP